MSYRDLVQQIADGSRLRAGCERLTTIVAMLIDMPAMTMRVPQMLVLSIPTSR
jgi:hypothetical protein